MIREAIRLLQAQGVLEVQHGVGSRFSSSLHKPLSNSVRLLLPENMQCLLQLNEVRLALEPAIARQAAMRANPEGIAELRRVHESMAAATTTDAAADADVAFHRQIAKLSENKIFGMLLDSITDLDRQSRCITIRNAGKQRAVQHHGRILAAIAAHAPAKAEAAMRYHIGKAIADLGMEKR